MVGRNEEEAARPRLGRANGTATVTSAPPIIRSARDRGMGLAIERASSSRNSLKQPLVRASVPLRLLLRLRRS